MGLVVEGEVAVWIVTQGGWSGVLPVVQGWRENVCHYLTHLFPHHYIGLAVLLMLLVLLVLLVLVIMLLPNLGIITLIQSL